MNRVNLALMGTAALASIALAGCGQGYTPSSGASVPGVQGGGDVLGGNPDNTIYKTASFEVLDYTLKVTLNMQAKIQSSTFVCGAGIDAVNGCPGANPTGFLEANSSALGIPVYNQADPLATQAPTMMTSAGFKVWDLSSGSACGRMVSDPALYMNGKPVLYPDGDYTNFTTLYVSLLGRLPTSAEIIRLHQLQADMANSANFMDPQNAVRTNATDLMQAKGAAACSAVLGSMEFLTAN